MKEFLACVATPLITSTIERNTSKKKRSEKYQDIEIMSSYSIVAALVSLAVDVVMDFPARGFVFIAAQLCGDPAGQEVRLPATSRRTRSDLLLLQICQIFHCKKHDFIPEACFSFPPPISRRLSRPYTSYTEIVSRPLESSERLRFHSFAFFPSLSPSLASYRLL